MSSKEHKNKIWNLINDINFGMLTTQDGRDLRARPMHLVQDEYEGTLWFYTKLSANKNSEINDEHAVCLTFSDHDDGVYISLSGQAHLTQDKTLIDRFWGPFTAAWFDNGKDDPEVALLEIKIHKGEHWEANENKIFQLYEIAKANLTDEAPDIGENEKFG